ncbi:MAG TPA: STAS domain-containing protein [Actinomycetota bacterium]|nr:STAS domain-containing protein [Actinomycetota bacterium]
MFEQQCSVDVHVRNGVALVVVGGELDMATSPVLVDRLTHLERTDVESILVDLRAVTFLDCSAIHAFLTAHDHARQNGHRFILVGATALAQRIIDLTGTRFLLHGDETADVAQLTRLGPVDQRDPATEGSA